MLFNNSGRCKLISEATHLWGPAGIQTLLHQNCWEKLNIWINVFDRRYGHHLKEYEWNNRNGLSAAIRAGCEPYSPCALASAQLVRGVERHTELSVWMDSQSVQPECSTEGVSRTSSICLPLPTFQILAYRQPFLPSGSSSNIMNALILLEAILRQTRTRTLWNIYRTSIFHNYLPPRRQIKKLGRAKPDRCFPALERVKTF
jgi:hypothetical protein